MTFRNINEPLKVLVELDSLTCCPEVELSLTEEAFCGLSGGGVWGKPLSFSSLSCLLHSVFLGAVEEQEALFQKCLYALEKEKARAGSVSYYCCAYF
jgi:hypothetical protein